MKNNHLSKKGSDRFFSIKDQLSGFYVWLLMDVILFFPLVAYGQSTVSAKNKLTVVKVWKIWDYGDYNSFTDLAWFKGYFYCTFREGKHHAGGDQGKVRVIRSRDGKKWEPVAFFSIPVKENTVVFDMRDPKISVANGDSLMLSIGVALYIGNKAVGMAPRVSFSKDGLHWSDPEPIIIHDRWPWRPVWHHKKEWVVSYWGNPGHLLLENSEDGFVFLPVDTLHVPRNSPNEVTIRFDKYNNMIALIRTGGGDQTAFLGKARPPYTHWTYHAVGRYIGGPDFLVLSPGRYICAGRMYINKEPRTCVAFLDDKGHLSEPLVLPSGGDNSYPGMVIRNGILWMSYYSSHEGKTSIYMAKIRIK